MSACLDSAEVKQSKGLCPSGTSHKGRLSWGWPEASRHKPQEEGPFWEGGKFGSPAAPVRLELFLPGNLLLFTP